VDSSLLDLAILTEVDVFRPFTWHMAGRLVMTGFRLASIRLFLIGH
jgi:hypothetical protein